MAPAQSQETFNAARLNWARRQSLVRQEGSTAAPPTPPESQPHRPRFAGSNAKRGKANRSIRQRVTRMVVRRVLLWLLWALIPLLPWLLLIGLIIIVLVVVIAVVLNSCDTFSLLCTAIGF